MPFRSKIQRALFSQLVKEGKMTQATFDEWDRATDPVQLPERVSPRAVPTTLPKRRGRRR